MVPELSHDFLLLAAALIARLPSDTAPDESIFLQLQGLFGSMLMSALQLMDRREVVQVALPTGRSVWQITSSTGLPYTLHLNLPSVPPPPAPEAQAQTVDQIQEEYAYRLAKSLEGMYCPCTGFAYNSLAGERNYFCKHLLALLLSHQMGSKISTRVHMSDVIGLLGLNKEEPGVKVELRDETAGRLHVKPETVS